MAFSELFIKNLKTKKIMEDFREKTGDGFGRRDRTDGLLYVAKAMLSQQSHIPKTLLSIIYERG